MSNRSMLLNPARHSRTMNFSNVSPIKNPETQAVEIVHQQLDPYQARKAEYRRELVGLYKELDRYKSAFDQVPNWQQLIVQEADKLMERVMNLDYRTNQDYETLTRPARMIPNITMAKENWLMKAQADRELEEVAADLACYKSSFDQVPNWQQLIVQEADRLLEWV